MSAKSERITHSVHYRCFYRCVQSIIQVAALPRHNGTNGLMNEIFFNTLYTYHAFHTAGTAQQMTGHGLGRIDVNGSCRITESQMNGSRLKQIVVVGSRTMGIDISHFLRTNAGLFHG